MSIQGLLTYLADAITEYGVRVGPEWLVDYQEEERSTQVSTSDRHVVTIRPLSVVFARELEPLAGSTGGATHFVVVLGFTAWAPKRATPLQGYDEIVALYRFLTSHGMRRGGSVYVTMEEVSGLEFTQEAGQVIGEWQQRYHLRAER